MQARDDRMNGDFDLDSSLKIETVGLGKAISLYALMTLLLVPKHIGEYKENSQMHIPAARALPAINKAAILNILAGGICSKCIEKGWHSGEKPDNNKTKHSFQVGRKHEANIVRALSTQLVKILDATTWQVFR